MPMGDCWDERYKQIARDKAENARLLQRFRNPTTPEHRQLAGRALTLDDDLDKLSRAKRRGDWGEYERTRPRVPSLDPALFQQTIEDAASAPLIDKDALGYDELVARRAEEREDDQPYGGR